MRRKIEFWLHADGRFRAAMSEKDSIAFSSGKTFLENQQAIQKILSETSVIFAGIMSAQTSREEWFFISNTPSRSDEKSFEQIKEKLSGWRKRCIRDGFIGVSFWTFNGSLQVNRPQ